MPQEEDDALDKIVRDQDLELDEASPEDARQRGGLDEQDDTGIPRPSDDGDADADMDEPGGSGDSHDTN